MQKRKVKRMLKMEADMKREADKRAGKFGGTRKKKTAAKPAASAAPKTATSVTAPPKVTPVANATAPAKVTEKIPNGDMESVNDLNDRSEVSDNLSDFNKTVALDQTTA